MIKDAEAVGVGIERELRIREAGDEGVREEEAVVLRG